MNDIEGAKENFRKCVEQRIYFSHVHAWSCALLKWISAVTAVFATAAGSWGVNNLPVHPAR